MKTVDVTDIERGVSDLLQGGSSCQIDGSAIRDCELQEKFDGLVKRNGVVTIGGERKREEPPTVSKYRTKSVELYAEDVDQHMAILPEAVTTAAEISLEDIQVGDLGKPMSSDLEKLRYMIRANRHLLIVKRNALTPAAREAVCDIDVVDVNPIAQRLRPVAPKFCEKMADMIKGLLTARIIRPSTPPWASPIVVIIKKNGEDI